MEFEALNWLSTQSGTDLTHLTLDNTWHYIGKNQKQGYIGGYHGNKIIVSYNNFKDPVETKAFFIGKKNAWTLTEPVVKPLHQPLPEPRSWQWWYDAKSFPHLSSQPNGVPYFHHKGLADQIDCLDIRYGQWDSNKWLAVLAESAITGKPMGFQRIFEDGSKKFSAGLDKTDDIPMLRMGYGDLEGNDYNLCEGVATSLTVKAAKGTAICCFDASNVPKVAMAIKAKNPKAHLTYCMDNDKAGIRYGQLALEKFGGRIVLPTFTKEQQENGLNDFNDLYQIRGLEAVKRCFEVSNLQPHHPGSHWYLQNGPTFNTQYVGIIRDDLTDTEYLPEPLGLGSNMESGKTYSLVDYANHNCGTITREQFRPEGSPFHQVKSIHSGMRVMILVPTIALAQNAAQRFNATYYSDIKGISTDYKLIVTTIDSMTHFEPPDILIIDEVIQCFSALADAKRQIHLEKLKYFVKNAKRLIISDANLTPECVANQWIEKIRGHQTAFVVPSAQRKQDRKGMKVYKYEPYQYQHEGKTVKVAARDLLLQHVKTTHLTSNKRVIIASDSANLAHAIYLFLSNPKTTLAETLQLTKNSNNRWKDPEFLKTIRQDPNILLITKNTLGDPRVQAFLKNPSQEALKYRYIIFSPAMGSGVSIEIPPLDPHHFDEVCWFANGKPLTAEASLQLPFRYRSKVPIFLAITPNQGNLETNAEKLLNQRITKRVVNSQLIDVIALIRQGRDQEALEALKDKMNGAAYEIDEIVVQIEAEQNTSKMEFESRIVKHLSERGFQLVDPHAKKYERAQTWLQHSKDLRDFYTLIAEDITAQQRETLKQAENQGQPLSELERLQVRKYDIKTFSRLETLEHQEDILFYEKYRLQISRAKLLTRDFSYWLKQANDQDRDKPDYQRKNLATEFIQGQAVFEECHLTTIDGQITYNGPPKEYITKDTKNLLKKYGILCDSKVVKKQGKAVRLYTINLPWLKVLNFYLSPSQSTPPAKVSAYQNYLIGENKTQEN